MTSERKTSKAMNIILWVAQIILATCLIWAATMKLFQPAGKLAEMWTWTKATTGLVKFTGTLDLLAGTGLLLPAHLRIRPKLTIFAAYGIIVLMIAAIIFP